MWNGSSTTLPTAAEPVINESWKACSEHRLLRTAYHFFYHVFVCLFLTNLVRVQFYKLSFLFQLIIFALPLYKSPWYVWIFSFTIKLLLVAVVSLKLPLLLFFLVRSLAKVNVTSWNPNHMFYTVSPFLSYALVKVISYDQQKVLKMSTINGKGKQISFFIIQRLGHIWFFVINWKSGSPGSISHYLSSTDLD